MYVEAALSNYDSGSTYFESICHIWKFTRKVTDIYVTTISNYISSTIKNYVHRSRESAQPLVKVLPFEFSLSMIELV